VQLVHDGLAVLLVEAEPGLGRPTGVFGLSVVFVNLGQTPQLLTWYPQFSTISGHFS
jgi:hypothetical protein